MQTSLIDTIWLSEKRKKLIQYLLEAPKDINEIKSFFDVPTRSIGPEIKKLEKQEIIIEDCGEYRLSNIGKIIAKKMQIVLNAEKLIERDREYWQNNDLDSIPSHLHKRLGELNNCTFRECEIDDFFEPPLQFTECLQDTENVMGFMPYLIPFYQLHGLDLLEKGKKLTLLYPLSIFEVMKTDYPIEMKKIITSKNTDVFVCNDEIKRPMINVLDNFVTIGFFGKDGTYRSRELISTDESAIKWAKDLFAYYILSSKKVDEI